MPKAIKYTALFVKDPEALLKRFPPKHENIFGHHSTIDFEPENLNRIILGKESKLKILGRAFDEYGDDLLVENPRSCNKYAHITISRSKNAPKKYSQLLFSKAMASSDIEYFQNETVDIVEGYFDGERVVTKGE